MALAQEGSQEASWGDIGLAIFNVCIHHGSQKLPRMKVLSCSCPGKLYKCFRNNFGVMLGPFYVLLSVHFFITRWMHFMITLKDIGGPVLSNN